MKYREVTPNNPKEYFLTKVNAALEEFEGKTGVEVHNIEIVRIDPGDIHRFEPAKTAITEWRLILG